MSNTSTPVKFVYEKVHDEFKAFANKLFDELGEPRALTLVVDWAIGKKDFPPGFTVTRSGKVNATDLLDIIEQLGRVSAKLLHFHNQYVQDAKLHEAKLIKDVKDLEEKLKVLQEAENVKDGATD